jgi:diaminohydroxyphosphoribosylaminopyrimidine deaminase/5-amino-6-(5-phosphoribosylamino)uracil reductase
MDRMAFDRQMMTTALRVARRGLGTTAPNPTVGAVIADPSSGEVIARGWTRPGGRPHGETEALRRAGARARGMTMYVTLEPCAHHGVTPPCADAIVAAGLHCVVAGIEDPDPRTAGQGLERLRRAGLDIRSDVLADEVRWMAIGHILRITEGRPFVQFKIALAADGSVPRGAGGRPTWATGAEARALGHLLRAEADAILVGGQTVRDDNPELTCRLPGLGHRSPLRIILSRDLDLPLDAKLFADVSAAPVWIFSSPGANKARQAALEALGVEVSTGPSAENGLRLAAIMQILAARGITRLLVEGGPTVWRAVSAAGCVDEVVLFQAGPGSGERELAPQLLLQAFVPAPDMRLADTRRIGDDRVHIFRRS